MDRRGDARLKALLFTDMVGSTELRTRLGEARADDLRRDHDQLLADIVGRHEGEVLRWTGDGVKASFASASAAVAAAVDLQRAVRRYSLGAGAVAAFEVRAGIAVGEVTLEDDDEHGVAVIEGARLEALAAPGEILATDLVARLGHRRVDATFEEVGVRVLKGLDQPVSVVRVISTADEGGRALPRTLVSDHRFPLVGRTEELGAARRRCAEVVGGARATVLVTGPPGLGKSRFVAQVAADAHDAGATVLAGVCDSDLAVPYQPFAIAFSDAADADDELAAAIAGGTGPLGPLFPARRAGRLDDPGAAARIELFDAVVSLVGRLASDQPLVLVLEDLHWAAPATIQLLRHLVLHGDGARVLLLASYRSEEIGPAHPLQALLAEVATHPDVTRVELEGLREVDVAELVAARVPDAPDAPGDGLDAFARRIHAESAGSPFFVCELLHHLASTGELAALIAGGGAERLPIPDSVRDVVASRLGRLSDEQRRLLTIAATIGLAFDLELLAAAVGSDADAVLEDLEDIERVALVNELDAGRFTFTHAIVRATLLEQQSATRAARSHRSVAESIVALDRADFDELAHHWRLAGDEDRAIAHLEQAARRDLEALAYETAIERFEAVLDHHRRAPTSEPAAIGRAVLGIGLGRRALGELSYLPSIEEAGRIGRKLRDPDLVIDAAVASIWPGNFFITAGETRAELVELNEDALALVAPDDPRRIRVLTALAGHLSFDEDRPRRSALLAEAQHLAREIGDPELVGSTYIAEFIALWDPSTLERRVVLVRDLARLARASEDAELGFFAGFLAAVVDAERGDLARARAGLAHLVGTVATTQNFYFAFLVERLQVSIAIFLGGTDVQEQVNDLFARYDGTHADTAGTWAIQTGGLLFQQGVLGTLTDQLRAEVGRRPAPNMRAAYGLALLENGEPDAAAEVLDAFVDPPLNYFWLTTMQVLAELAAGLGRTERARAIADRLEPYVDQLGITASGSYCYGLVSTTLGIVARATGDHARADALLSASLARAEAMGATFEASRARQHLEAGTPAAVPAPTTAPTAETLDA
jgi:class 3 adenylate cyclase/tetratricopeptide (TPR) repeat protein